MGRRQVSPLPHCENGLAAGLTSASETSFAQVNSRRDVAGPFSVSAVATFVAELGIDMTPLRVHRQSQATCLRLPILQPLVSRQRN